MGFTGMFSVETILKIIGFGVKVGAYTARQTKAMSQLKMRQSTVKKYVEEA